MRRTPSVRATSRPRYWSLTAYHALRGASARVAARRGETVICQSRWGAERYRSHGYRDVTAVPYPVDLEFFSPGPAPDETVDAPRFLHLGRLDPRKRIDLLVAAFERVRAAFPRARLEVVGRPGYVPEVTDLVSKGVPGVTYRPHVPRGEVVALLRSAPVVVQTSTHETFGTAVAEALACGVTCVVGPENGTAEYLDAASVVFAAYTPDAVAEAMILAWRNRIADPEAAVASARAAAVRHFSEQTVAAAVADLLARIANRPSAYSS